VAREALDTLDPPVIEHSNRSAFQASYQKPPTVIAQTNTNIPRGISASSAGPPLRIEDAAKTPPIVQTSATHTPRKASTTRWSCIEIEIRDPLPSGAIVPWIRGTNEFRYEMIRATSNVVPVTVPSNRRFARNRIHRFGST
jgi:hypothetical protein